MEPEVIDISSYGEPNSSSNFGGGIELLMNEKKGGKPGASSEEYRRERYRETRIRTE